jgi:endonuclease/exonuclease/phosphatase family metal-dependent hydrolase
MVWARLKHIPTQREIVVAVTHFDNTMPAQTKMAALAHEKLQGFVDKGLPVVFVGDFNTDESRGDYPMLTSGGWRDAYLASPKASPTGRDSNVPTSGSHRIDHILYHGDALKAVEWHRVDKPNSEALSDHYPVFARLEWK